VVAADEWAENVDNNAFTNAAAKANYVLRQQKLQNCWALQQNADLEKCSFIMFRS
jgi:trehalose/maltose hydrolase-like predicted phosphorylase